ncbi:DUF5110 domain-containing protein [Sporolactobacillus sp. STCC-11]|uniref:DUF5110 domain-containing protein n=1 Tax=Sporolactobacillus caesalpiniae TaxID=3230362 RepID=UPI003398F498
MYVRFILKKEAAIPLYPVQNYVGEKAIDQLTFDLYAQENGEKFSYMHYQDDGKSFDYLNGSYNLYELTAHLSDSGKELYVSINRLHGGYDEGYDSYKLILNNINAVSVTQNNVPIPFEVKDNKTVFTVEEGELQIKL